MAAWMGMGPEEVGTVRYAAVLHDVGKMGVPDSILNKAGELSELEWRVVRRHPAVGASMLSRVPGFERVHAAVAAHHERFDGKGYPAGLAGAEMPLEARIVSVVDAYDAMTNDRPYRKALSHAQAVEELISGAGSQFDPAVVEAARAVLEGNRGLRAGGTNGPEKEPVG